MQTRAFLKYFVRNCSLVEKYFWNLPDKHFPQNHAKVGNSCTKSMKTIITNHSKNILGKKLSINKSNCNCQNKEACPLNTQCQRREVVYKSTLSGNQLNYKKKSILELQKNLSMDSCVITIHLSEMNFIKTIKNFLRNSGKIKMNN